MRTPLHEKELEAAIDKAGEFGGVTTILAGCPKQQQPVLDTEVAYGSFAAVSQADIYNHSIWKSRCFQTRGEYRLTILERKDETTTVEWMREVDQAGDGTSNEISTSGMEKADDKKVLEAFADTETDITQMMVVAYTHRTVNRWNKAITERLVKDAKEVHEMHAECCDVGYLSHHRLYGDGSSAWNYKPDIIMTLFVGMRVALCKRIGRRPKHTVMTIKKIGRDMAMCTVRREGSTVEDEVYLHRHQFSVTEPDTEVHMYWQFPVVPAHAKTAMSVQGVTLTRLFWDVDVLEHERTPCGATHVVAGRVRAKHQICLVGAHHRHIKNIPSRCDMDFIKGEGGLWGTLLVTRVGYQTTN